MTILSVTIAFLNDDDVDDSQKKANKQDTERLEKAAAKKEANTHSLPDQQCSIDQPAKSRAPMSSVNWKSRGKKKNEGLVEQEKKKKRMKKKEDHTCLVESIDQRGDKSRRSSLVSQHIHFFCCF